MRAGGIGIASTSRFSNGDRQPIETGHANALARSDRLGRQRAPDFPTGAHTVGRVPIPVDVLKLESVVGSELLFDPKEVGIDQAEFGRIGAAFKRGEVILALLFLIASSPFATATRPHIIFVTVLAAALADVVLVDSQTV